MPNRLRDARRAHGPDGPLPPMRRVEGRAADVRLRHSHALLRPGFPLRLGRLWHGLILPRRLWGRSMGRPPALRGWNVRTVMRIESSAPPPSHILAPPCTNYVQIFGPDVTHKRRALPKVPVPERSRIHERALSAAGPGAIGPSHNHLFKSLILNELHGMVRSLNPAPGLRKRPKKTLLQCPSGLARFML